ncbi:MAG: SDR family oxidoreductase [Halobacteriaceae archaeon]
MDTETALVTGCSSGIGRATAGAFLDGGWTVYATARDVDDLAALAERDGCETVPLDVTDPDRCAAVVDRVAEEAGGVTCLVNNAGYAQFGPAEDVPAAALHRQLAVNCYGPHRLTRLVLPQMRASGGGTVVAISSVLGLVSAPGYGAYAASKHALEGLTDALRPEVAQFDVDVVLLEPGPVATRFRERGLAELDALEHRPGYETVYRYLEDRAATSSLGTVGPAAVADAAVEAATCADPDPRVRVGPVAHLGGLASHLPTRWRDAAYRLAGRVLSR